MLSWFDYTLFGISLLVTLLIGIYFGCFGTKQSTTDEYLSGNKKMWSFPVGISVGVSHFSAVILMGFPAEVYRYGTQILLTFIPGIIVTLLTVYICLPVFFKSQLFSCYDYLEKRFDPKTKKLALFLSVFGEIVQFPILVYAPSLTFATATGYSVTTIAFTASAFCYLYTTIGGLKTVIWTDIFQFVIIVICMGLISGFGLCAIWEQGWETVQRGGRLALNFDLDLTRRDSLWIVAVGMSFQLYANGVTQQTYFQKYLSVPKFSDSVKSAIWGIAIKIIVAELCAIIGLGIYVTYWNCDPLLSRKITKHDELVPYFIKDVAGHIPGIQGLFIASVFSASLSTMSSNLNSVAGIIYGDFISRFVETRSEKTKSYVLKITALVIGILGTILVLVVEYMGEIIVLSVALRACTSGPLLGTFTLGMLFPRVNAKGAFYGGLSGMVALLCLYLPSQYYASKKLVTFPTKSLSIDGCWDNSTIVFNTTKTIMSNASEVPGLFRVSFYYYPMIGTLITMVLGLAISYLTQPDKITDKNLISSYFHFLLPQNLETQNQNSPEKSKLMKENSESL